MDVRREIEGIYKESHGHLTTVLMQKFGFLGLATVEDLVQEAFAKAMEQWPRKGLPKNPSGWLYQCCRNSAIDLINRSRKNGEYFDDQLGEAENRQTFENQIKDGRLKTLFDCCYPNLTPKTRIVLALKYVLDFRTETIAQHFGISGDAVEKMLYRTRQKLKSEDIPLDNLPDEVYKKRLPSVHKAIYLLFTEGWKEFQADERLQGLCEEALLLNTELIHSSLGDTDTLALQALMLFNIARLESRFDAEGKQISIEHQNRELWDRQLIKLGHNHLELSESNHLSSYHLEAVIAYKHCLASSFFDIDWESICRYYKVLSKIHPNPFVEINYAIALYHAGDMIQAHKRFDNLKNNRYLNSSKLLKKAIVEFNMKTIFS
ncbi:RNA polymerase sigma factor [Flagellimonas meridianipacifica]|uniref:RNA polymerase sigma-70 factor (ECF subfamily) n=1 Tax=Flagellimonas meridianipacifica TaxID=1080225 RepID=A0A2T0M9X8_9FLAO|nr:sigma-70 family RNA polymerase sigma factor [Allomuricauda pacifica]PRX54278.1 RNA polymerase sigma-70 factor (ECF subfamily) [Allomuricauda pacifica]